MQFRPLGSSGLTVSAIGLGGMPMSLASRPPRSQAIATIHAAFEAGVTFIDTADVYCKDHADIGHNESLIAEAVAAWGGDRSAIVVATKGGMERPNGAWTRNGHPSHLKTACEASLRALGVQAIDLYQLHVPDDAVPFADSVGALAELKSAGKIRHVGLSNVSVDQIEEARRVVEIVSVQNRCHPLDTTAWREGVIRHCEANGIAFLPYSPVGGGRDIARISGNPTLNAVAQRRGATPFEVALAWLLAASPAMIPIPGASKPNSIRSSASAADLALDPQDKAELNRAFLGG